MLRMPARMNGGGFYPRHLPLRPPPARGFSLQAPVGGWDALSPLADMPEDRAVVLDNWFPQPGYVEVRRGQTVHAGAMGSAAIETLMVYHGLTAAASKMFAATGSVIYDVTTAGGGSSSVTSLTSARWQWVNFTTSGGKFLWICNGADDPRHFNGSVWATPSITGVTGANIINVNAHKNRLWFVFKDSTKAGYLATGAVAGAVTEFELGGLFTKGGYLQAMATMTRDGGAGPDDLAVFISSKGQVAIYAGTDPASASTWELVGVYDVGAPIGYRCFTRVGGDLALVCIDGVVPLARALETDRAAIANIAITTRIQNAINEAARLYSGNFGWQLQPYPRGTQVILNVPVQTNNNQLQFVMNTLTGAWCRYTNIDVACWAEFKDNLYCGSNLGLVYQADNGGLDVIYAIDAIGQTAYNYYGMRGRLKRWTMLQPSLTTDSSIAPALALSTDFKDNASLGTPTQSASDAALYDSAVWDDAVYAEGSRNVADWTAISGIGQCASIHFRARTGGQTGNSQWGVGQWGVDEWMDAVTAADITLRLNGFNSVFEPGGFV